MLFKIQNSIFLIKFAAQLTLVEENGGGEMHTIKFLISKQERYVLQVGISFIFLQINVDTYL